jgi:hypothetical protein
MNVSKEYIFDLTNTLEINLDMLENLLPDRNLVDILKSVKIQFDMKKKLLKEMRIMKAKILIDSQIIEETKRKQIETEDYYRDNLKESEELILSKDEYIKIFEKKLKEVEIYVHKNNKNNDFDKYKDFKINDFIENNSQLVFKKDEICKDIAEIRNDICRIKIENRGYEENELEDSEIRKDELKKNIQNYIKTYKNQCRVIEMRIRLMKNYFNNSCYIFGNSK